jgi:hypothetical protein
VISVRQFLTDRHSRKTDRDQRKGIVIVMSAEELRQLCKDFRYGGRETDEDIVTRIRADIDEYRATFSTRPRPQTPPEPLGELLPLMGWLLYETSWFSLQEVRAAFESLPAEKRAASERAYRHLRLLANAARRLVWPEYAPRALGAIRAQALAESKRDTEDGYDEAYIIHQEAAEKHRSFLDSHAGRPDGVRKRFALDLDEVLLQLALAETGTACRTAERVICRWSQEFDDPADGDDETQWVQKMYLELTDAIEIGNRALTTAQRIKNGPGLVDKVDEHRLALVTSYRNPGVMTARAALLALALAPAMEHLQRKPARFATWPAERADLIQRFTAAYLMIGERIVDGEGAVVEMRHDHKRALVQLRLQLALLVPGHALPSTGPLDDEAVTVMSEWLSAEENASTGGPNHGNIMAAATMPLFLRSVLALRSLTGDPGGFLIWLEKWSALGRYATEQGRPVLLQTAITAATAPGASLRVGRE